MSLYKCVVLIDIFTSQSTGNKCSAWDAIMPMGQNCMKPQSQFGVKIRGSVLRTYLIIEILDWCAEIYGGAQKALRKNN